MPHKIKNGSKRLTAGLLREFTKVLLQLFVKVLSLEDQPFREVESNNSKAKVSV